MKNPPDRSSALLAGSLPRAVLLLAGPMFVSLPPWEWTRLFSRWFDPPVQGVWWAMNTATALHAVMSVAWFSSGRWMHKRV